MKDRPSFDSPIRNVIPNSWGVHGVARAMPVRVASRKRNNDDMLLELRSLVFCIDAIPGPTSIGQQPV